MFKESRKDEDTKDCPPAGVPPCPTIHLAGKAALGGHQLGLVLVVVFVRPPFVTCHIEQMKSCAYGKRSYGL